MIFGIGQDIVDNERIDKLLKQYGQRFIDKILCQEEQVILTKRLNKTNFLAKRFAAKEAFAKACGTGLRKPVILTNIAVLNDNIGKPFFTFKPVLQKWLESIGISNYHVSISDTDENSSALVILERSD